MTVNALRNDIEVATDHRGRIALEPVSQLCAQAIHPRQLVGKLLAPYWIAIRQVDVCGLNSLHVHFEKTSMAIPFVPIRVMLMF